MSSSGNIARRASARVLVGPVRVGGGAPIVVQSMTNTDTADIEGTVRQVQALARAGSELVRLMDENSTSATPLTAQEVTRSAVVLSALGSAQRAEELGLAHDRIILSAKVSGVQDLIAIYRDLAARCDYPLHLGLTEAGMGSKGVVASTAAMAVLLQEGIGDTIRVSLTPEPGGDRTREVIVAQEILQTMGLRAFTPLVSACPGCGRTTSTFFQELAEKIQSYLRAQMPVWRAQYRGVEDMHVAVMGCVVNGPGESKLDRKSVV